jgi:hypothetical protein
VSAAPSAAARLAAIARSSHGAISHGDYSGSMDGFQVIVGVLAIGLAVARLVLTVVWRRELARIALEEEEDRCILS